MTVSELETYYTQLSDNQPFDSQIHERLLQALESGEVRAAERTSDNRWEAVNWVKAAILQGFRSTSLAEIEFGSVSYFDKTAYPPRRLTLEDNIRLVPSGSAIRRGAHVAKGVIVMPPAYINVGAYVDEQTMVDSHALVGSCAQIGKRVHLSAAAQIGGVLEPSGALPVVIEDDVFVGGLVGLFEGIVVRKRAVLAPGVTLTSSTIVYDLVNGRQLSREIPEGAVVVPGVRPATGAYAKEMGLSVNAPVIVKYRDEKTNASTALESALR